MEKMIKSSKTALISIFVSFLFFNSNAFSQSDSLRRAIITYKDSTGILISNARKLIISKLQSNEKKAVIELKDFLQKIENDNYVSLFPMERWLLDYYVNDFNDILFTVMNFDSVYYNSFNYKIKPENDILAIKLVNYLKESSLIETQINQSGVSQEENEFLKLNLHFIFNVYTQSNYNDSLNLKANIFLEKYPYSSYYNYVRKYIRFQFEPSNGGLNMKIGLGLRFNSGPVRNTIDEGFLINFSIGVPYKKWDYDLRILVGPVQLQKDILVNGVVWENGSDANYLNCEFSIGRNLLKSKKSKLSPSIGIGITEFSPFQETIRENPLMKDVFVDIGNVIVGLNYQYKYPLLKKRRDYFSYNFGCLDFRYALSWHPSSNKNYQGLVHYFTFTWGFEIRGAKRSI